MNNLAVTFPVDLGNRTYETNLIKLLGPTFSPFRFAYRQSDSVDYGVNYRKHVWDRMRHTIELRRVVAQTTAAGSSVIFQGISPALYAFGIWDPKRTAIFVDWARLLYPSVLGLNLNLGFAWRIHRAALSKCRKFICITDAIQRCLADEYHVPADRLFRAPAPFDLGQISCPPRATPNSPRVLFIGGDLVRKGGDLLLAAWANRPLSELRLTMITNAELTTCGSVHALKGVRYGTDEHRKAIRECDILVLPTKIDSYPQVVGEAAAAGLVVITTRFALGASDVIVHGKTGFIEDSQDLCIERLKAVVADVRSIDAMKAAAFKHMADHFSPAHIRKRYLDILAL